jgi:hypothetical protein
LRETVLHSVCARFTTVLGPGSDGYHEDHIHLDRMVRHNNYKICQWNVWDPMPQIAPLMPAERPAEAPPRQVADHRDDESKPEAKPENRPANKSDAKPKGSGEPEAAQDDGPDDAQKADSNKPHAGTSKSQSDKPATKKRRHSRRS